MNTFYLGTHKPCWLWRSEVPLFVSYQALRVRKSALKPPTCRWALDSGGFTELSSHGRWTISAETYAEAALGYAASGGLDWAAVQDWMCEPSIRAKTGLTTEQHQRLTCESVNLLRDIAPSVPWVPVLQGWSSGDYFRHVEMYASHGVDLRDEPVVGLGSVCRRQATEEAECLVRELNGAGIRLHLFGFKARGLRAAHCFAHSADSMAWSFNARRKPVRLPGCPHTTCANCRTYAELWRSDLLASLPACKETSA